MSTALGLQVGERLKAARQKLGLSLRALGEMTGFSASFLSQVELGQTTPSLGSLQKISDALEMSLTSVLSADREPLPVLRKARRAAVRSEWSKAAMESLVPAGFDERLGAFLLQLDPDGCSGSTHYASERRIFMYCIKGDATLVFAEGTRDPLQVESGDSVMLDGPLTFSCENRTMATTHVLVVIAKVAS